MRQSVLPCPKERIPTPVTGSLVRNDSAALPRCRDVGDAVPYGMTKGGQSRPPLRNTSYRSQSGFARPCAPETSPMAANSITSDEPP